MSTLLFAICTTVVCAFGGMVLGDGISDGRGRAGLIGAVAGTMLALVVLSLMEAL